MAFRCTGCGDVDTYAFLAILFVCDVSRIYLAVLGHQVTNSLYRDRKIFEDCRRIMTNAKG